MMGDVRRQVVIWAVVAIWSVTAAVSVRAVEEDAEAKALVKKALAALPTVPFVAKLRLTVHSGAARQLELSQKFLEGARASYMEVIAPEEFRGIRHLLREHTNAPPEQYLKLTASRNVIRVTDEVRRQPFLGSTFYVGDLVEPDVDDFTYRFAGRDNVSGRRCTLVETAPKNLQREVYGKIIAAIDPKDLVIMRRHFFDKKGQLLKVATVETVQKIDGHWTTMDQVMKNVQDNTTSRLETLEIKYNAELPDEVFTPKHMQH